MVGEGCTIDQKVAMSRIFLFNYWCVIEQYIKNKSSYETMILYEDLCSNPREALVNVFSALDNNRIPNIHTRFDHRKRKRRRVPDPIDPICAYLTVKRVCNPR